VPDTDIDPKGLVLHSDNGKPMRGATMTATLQWLGVVPSFSRPHVSNDNPYVTPDERHFGREHAILVRRHAVYLKARRKRPERWSRDTRNWTPIGVVTLNPEPQLAAAG
jgi:putative transposase